MNLDLDAYFARIKYDGPREPTMDVLSVLHEQHPAAIPFENLNPFFDLPVHVEPAAITSKLVDGKRGGYCFEQNSLFYDALIELGFVATPLGARVILRSNDGDPRPPLTHRLTLVRLPEGVFVADVGFGGHSPTAPLKLEHAGEQETPHGVYRITRDGAVYEIQSRADGNWVGMYQFTLEPQTSTDFEVANWYTSTHPSSRFRQNLIASIIDGDCRRNLLNTRLTVRCGDKVKERTLATPQELDRILKEDFGIDPPAPIETVWEKIPKT